MRNWSGATATGLPIGRGARLGVRRVAIVALVVVGTASAAAQETGEYRGTEEQRMACTGDVFRLCWSEIPSVSRIVDCLKREKPSLTDACRAVFDENSPRTASNRWRRHHRVALATRRAPSLRYGDHNERPN